MILPWIVGAVGVSGALYVLYGLISHVVTPLSMLVGVLAGLGTLVFLKQNRVLSGVGDELAVTVAEVGVAVLTGFVVFKAFAWILPGAGVVLTVVLTGILFFEWLPAIILLLRALAPFFSS